MFLGQEVHYYMVYIAYFTELILQICDYAQKRRIWRENCKYALFIATFAPDEKLPSSATLATLQVYIISLSEVHIEQSLLFLGN